MGSENNENSNKLRKSAQSVSHPDRRHFLSDKRADEVEVKKVTSVSGKDLIQLYTCDHGPR
jgi:hypothetical protein